MTLITKQTKTYTNGPDMKKVVTGTYVKMTDGSHEKPSFDKGGSADHGMDISALLAAYKHKDWKSYFNDKKSHLPDHGSDCGCDSGHDIWEGRPDFTSKLALDHFQKYTHDGHDSHASDIC